MAKARAGPGACRPGARTGGAASPRLMSGFYRTNPPENRQTDPLQNRDRNMSITSKLALAAALFIAAPALAQDHGTHGANDKTDAVVEAYEQVTAKMHENMAIDLTGDADVDFVQGMIPHHQGAIDMAKVVLQYGKDPEIRKLAEGVIAAQEGEIAFMKEWLKKHGK